MSLPANVLIPVNLQINVTNVESGGYLVTTYRSLRDPETHFCVDHETLTSRIDKLLDEHADVSFMSGAKWTERDIMLARELGDPLVHPSAMSERTPPEPEHASDCAVHNAPAMEAGECDCGAAEAAEVNREAMDKLGAGNKGVAGAKPDPGKGVL